MKRLWLALVLLVAGEAARAQVKLPATKPSAVSKTISAAAYRALLQGALDKITAVEKRPPTDVRPALRPLDAPFTVTRPDGQSQSTRGDEWNQLLSNGSGKSAAKLGRDETSALKSSLASRLQALDAWTRKDANGHYYAAFDAQKVVDEAVSSGQIRVGPPPLQKWLGDVQTAIGDAIDRFFKWLGSLMPKSKAPPPPSAKLPDLSWLWFLFWALMVSLLGVLLFLAARALSGGSFTLWGIGRRRPKEAELRDEDAALFQMAPEELRDRADQFASQGNFREALRHRFISLLVLLDAQGTWRYDIRRTNWEHIALLRREESKRPLVAPLTDLTRAFDRVRYGGAPCDEEGWNGFQAGVREVESQVGGRAVAR